ncbi:AI-2E family transporter [Candidatus Kaiserbacteria bacterium CG10_big_fil_rev_8_21_14_0_10_43_70]|uniref:AI-2E family transporter n=1 Tax=Candidatus Kaiserbacteria bacterium CG10_big_fil_rev_8_21_14_0_10_43_70 TaxID=1974605 RepID=A0A2H0UIW7_9BACT|nr:MAG: AI-2E family transporter [Candidatus Kaiserbacteria bacterium CG10_big_fil_rev_8_21_14_0_10_43_70]
MVDTFTLIQRSLFFSLIVGITAIFVWMLWDVILPIFWALVFAVLLFPLFARIRKGLRGRGIPAAALTLVFTLLVIFVPLYVLGSMIANEAIDLYLSLADRNFSLNPISENVSAVNALIETFTGDSRTVTEHITEFVRSISSWLATQAVSIGTTTFGFAIKFVLMLYVLFFLLKDGERLGAYLMKIFPLGDEKEKMIFFSFTSTTRAIIKGTVIVSLVQGLLGAILFSIAGVPSPILWGTLMAILALIPAIGPGLVWVPVGIILLLSGDVFGAVIVLAGGATLISLSDNILRPILIGRDTEMPDALILLSILGGLATFGLAGIVIGPVIAALFVSIWNLFAHEYELELKERG